MQCERFNKKRIYCFVVPLFTLTALVLAALIIFQTNFDDTNEIHNVPEQADSVPSEDDSQENNGESKVELKSQVQEKTTELPSNDPYMDELQNEDVKRSSSRHEALEKVPVLKWRNELVDNMRKEDVKQTIENLPNFDDTHLATTSIGSLPGNGRFSNLFVTRLARVRKLYSIGQENPALVVPHLKRAHRESFANWPEASRKRFEDYDKGIRRYSEPDAYSRARRRCLAATYLLAEFGDYDSLPLLSEQYKIHHVWPPPNILHAPVPPAITFYAMHRLASSHPRHSLSSATAKALDEYLKAAEEFVPPPTQIKVTIWDSSYSESDPRFEVLGVKKEVLQGQKSMTMSLYPHIFKDGSQMQSYNCIKSEKLEELFEKLDAFVQLAYTPPID